MPDAAIPHAHTDETPGPAVPFLVIPYDEADRGSRPIAKPSSWRWEGFTISAGGGQLTVGAQASLAVRVRNLSPFPARTAFVRVYSWYVDGSPSPCSAGMSAKPLHPPQAISVPGGGEVSVVVQWTPPLSGFWCLVARAWDPFGDSDPNGAKTLESIRQVFENRHLAHSFFEVGPAV